MVIHSGNHQHDIVVSNTVPGLGHEQDPYRSELAGMYASIRFIYLLSKYFDIAEGTIRYGCDGQSALVKSFTSPCNSNQKDFDLISAIKQNVLDCPIEIEWEHVHGHRDKILPISMLTTIEKLNVIADMNAKEHASRHSFTKHTCTNVIGEFWPIYKNDNTKITSNTSITIEKEINKRTLIQHWESRGRLHNTDASQIDTKSLAHAMKQIKFGRHRFITKYVSRALYLC